MLMWKWVSSRGSEQGREHCCDLFEATHADVSLEANQARCLKNNACKCAVTSA